MATRKGGRKAGLPNYKAELLLEVIEEIRPIGTLGWQQVARKYKDESHEEVLRNFEDVKRQFTSVLANYGRPKPTGNILL